MEFKKKTFPGMASPLNLCIRSRNHVFLGILLEIALTYKSNIDGILYWKKCSTI